MKLDATKVAKALHQGFRDGSGHKPMPKDQNRRTPRWFFERLQDRLSEIAERKIRFKLDAAASPENKLCQRFYTEQQDGLAQPWKVDTFCNPPFKRFGLWVQKAYDEAVLHNASDEVGGPVIALLGPVGCSQSWFWEYVKFGTTIVPDARLAYLDSKTGMPTSGGLSDSNVYVWGPGFWHDPGTSVAWRYVPMVIRDITDRRMRT